MSSTDFVFMIATMAGPTTKRMAWDKGGKGVVLGWVEMMKAKAKGTRCRKP